MSVSFLLPQPAIIVAAAKRTVHLMYVEIRGFIIVPILCSSFTLLSVPRIRGAEPAASPDTR